MKTKYGFVMLSMFMIMIKIFIGSQDKSGSDNFDQLFIGADGIDIERGTTTFNELMGLSQVMAESAREVIVMVESDKIGRKIPNLELPWHKVTTLITDNNLAEDICQAIKGCGVQLICADVND